MGWTTPRTWVDGEVETAAILNAHIRDNLNAIVPNGPDAWTAFTPTLVQSGAVTKTVTYAKYMKVGRLVIVQVALAVTGTGTASNDVVIGLPLTAAGSNGLPIGSGLIYNASNFATYPAIAELRTSTTVELRDTDASGIRILGSADFTEALASGDNVQYCGMYEATS